MSKLAPMPEPRLPEGALAHDWERYYVERDVALRERIAALAKYAEHPKSCELYRLVIESDCGPCNCGLSVLMDTLRGDGLV